MKQNVYTVAQINAYIKNMFTQDYMLRFVLVKGEGGTPPTILQTGGRADGRGWRYD